MRKALEKTYTGICSIFTRPIIIDEETGIQRQSSKRDIIYKDIPCALSVKNIGSTIQTEIGVAYKEIKLFLAPEIVIPINSELEITQNNIKGIYKKSGIPAVYETHQEITLSETRIA